MMGFFDGPAGRSMNRLGSFMAYCGGWALLIAGIVHLFARDAGNISLAVMGIGAGLFGGGIWAKNKGKQLENGH